MSQVDAPPNPANAPSAAYFASLGIAPGARVLDVGCGNGDLSRLIARLVGPAGEVIGIDRSDAALAAARAHPAGREGAAIRYRVADLADDLPALGRFDAIVGRRVLMYLPDAPATLARLAALMRPGGVVAFQEHARAGLPSGAAELPEHRRLYDLMWDTVAAEGGDVRLALRLPVLMARAGLSDARARGEAILLHPDAPSFLPTLARAMLPRMIERGVANAAALDLDALPARLAAEHRASGGAVVWDVAMLVSARA